MFLADQIWFNAEDAESAESQGSSKNLPVYSFCDICLISGHANGDE